MLRFSTTHVSPHPNLLRETTLIQISNAFETGLRRVCQEQRGKCAGCQASSDIINAQHPTSHAKSPCSDLLPARVYWPFRCATWVYWALLSYIYIETRIWRSSERGPDSLQIPGLESAQPPGSCICVRLLWWPAFYLFAAGSASSANTLVAIKSVRDFYYSWFSKRRIATCLGQT